MRSPFSDLPRTAICGLGGRDMETREGMTRIARIRADLPTATHEPADVAWLVEMVEKLNRALLQIRDVPVDGHGQAYYWQGRALAQEALARLEEPDAN